MNETSETNLTQLVELYPISTFEHTLFSLVYYSISIVSILGNLLIILAIIINKSMHNVTNYFITNIALADIIISIFCTPFQFHAAILQEWTWLPILCKLGPFSTTLNINISVLTLVAISLDRFYVIYYPLKPKLRIRHCFIIIALIWLGSSLLSSYQLFNYSVNSYNINSSESSSNFTNITANLCENNDQRFLAYHHVLFVIQYLIPFLILWFTFFAIGYKIYFKAEKKILCNRSSLTSRKKVIKMILIVLFCFIICWTPLQLYNILSIAIPAINNFYYINIIWLVSNMFAMSNSCYNVLIYGFCSTRFRREFLRIYRKLLCLRAKPERHTSIRIRVSGANSFRETAIVLDSPQSGVQTKLLRPKNHSFNSFS